MCGEEQPGMENFGIFPRWDQSCLAKVYNFMPKCSNSSPKCANSLPWRENGSVIPSWELDCQEKKIFFNLRNSREIPHALNYPTKQCLRKKCLALVHSILSEIHSNHIYF